MEKYLPLLKNSNMFRGVSEDEIKSMLSCLDAKVVSYKKGAYLLHSGEIIHTIGFVISGMVLIQKEDYWGNCTILQEIAPGFIYAEAYACLPDMPADVYVTAAMDTTIMEFNVKKMFSVCSSACTFHNRLIQNLMSTMALKTVRLTKKIEIVTKKTIRDRLLSYLSNESIRNQKDDFVIPFNREQLADYLSVDRSALSNEISKLQKEGILKSSKNHFTLLSKDLL